LIAALVAVYIAGSDRQTEQYKRRATGRQA
jgi:hypothetical protein